MEHRLAVYKTHDTPGDGRERDSVRGCDRTYCSAPAVLRMYCSYHVHHCTTHQHSTVHRGADASGWADRRRATAARQPAAWETFMPPGHRAIAPLRPPTTPLVTPHMGRHLNVLSTALFQTTFTLCCLEPFADATISTGITTLSRNTRDRHEVQT